MAIPQKKAEEITIAADNTQPYNAPQATMQPAEQKKKQLGDLKDLSRALRAEGLSSEARYIDSGVRSFTFENNVLTLLMTTKLATDMISRSKGRIERILSSLLGEQTVLNVSTYREEERGDDKT